MKRQILRFVTVAVMTISFGWGMAGAAGAARVVYVPSLRAGNLGPMGLSGATLGRAIRHFGEPSSLRGGGNGCTARWSRLGLRLTLANFGGQDACTRSGGYVQAIAITGAAGRRSWRTVRHLRVGDTVDRLRRLYPSASRHRSTWWLVAEQLPYGDAGKSPILSAYVAGGRVRSLLAWIGNAGD